MKIRINVVPNSSKEKIVKVDEESYKIYLTKPAHEGKANEQLIKLLKHKFKANIKIVKGKTFRNKIIEVKQSQ
jgi:uncharacterized protein (TIGR00251 family)